jgi:predicted short-subunit dehydrogenase-like oxidoreductase (DUF2520 family)
MLPAMKRPSIAIIGAGPVGSTLAKHMATAGYSITEIISRKRPRSLAKARRLARSVGASAATATTARLHADVIWFCVPDAEVAEAAADLSSHAWNAKIALHSSGVLTSDALGILRRKGAAVASVHPLMTFVRRSAPQLRDVTFAIEGDSQAARAAFEIVRKLGGNPVRLRRQDKAAYHAFATVVCPLLVSLLASAEAVALLAKISGPKARRRMFPMLRQTLANYERLGPAKSFSGPFVRGDVATVRQHLSVLASAPAAKRVYIALAEAALESLPSHNTSAIQELMAAISQETIRRSVKRTSQASRRPTPPG